MTPQIPRETRRLITILTLGAVLPLIDSTITGVALNRLALSLHATVAVIGWVVTGYAVAAALVIPISGWAVARFGGRRVWLSALLVFLLGSALCALAPSAGALIGFRVLQGVGGGLMMPVLQTMLVRSAGPGAARQALAAIGGPAVIAPVLGPLLGGLILTWSSWRLIFAVNVPICLLALALAARRLPADQPSDAPRLDLTGLLLLSPALATLVYALSQLGRPTPPARWQLLGGVTLGLALLAAFGAHAARERDAALFAVRLLRRPHFLGASVSMLLAGAYFYGGLVLLPLYYQRVLGYSALGAGAALGLSGLGALTARYAAGRLTPRAGPRTVVLAGLALAALGTVPFSGAPPRPGPWLLGIALAVRGAGVGVSTISVMAAAYHGLDQRDVPHASVATRVLAQLGGALGAAVLGAVLGWQLRVTHPGAAAFWHTCWWLLGATVLALAPATLLPGRDGPDAGRRGSLSRANRQRTRSFG